MITYLFVDGYNIINKWPSLKKAKTKNLDYARQMLIDIMKIYADYTGIKVNIVFDGTAKTSAKKEKNIAENFNVLFSDKSQTADSMIERLVYNIKEKNQVAVATDDHCQQNMVFGMGASYISCAMLAKKVSQVYGQLKEDLQKLQKQKTQFHKISI